MYKDSSSNTSISSRQQQQQPRQRRNDGDESGEAASDKSMNANQLHARWNTIIAVCVFAIEP